MDELIEELEELASQPVIDFHAYKKTHREAIQLLVDQVLHQLALQHEPQPQACRPRLVWTSDRVHELSITNAELLDSAFGHWSLECLTVPSTDHRPC